MFPLPFHPSNQLTFDLEAQNPNPRRHPARRRAAFGAAATAATDRRCRLSTGSRRLPAASRLAIALALYDLPFIVQVIRVHIVVIIVGTVSGAPAVEPRQAPAAAGAAGGGAAPLGGGGGRGGGGVLIELLLPRRRRRLLLVAVVTVVLLEQPEGLGALQKAVREKVS